MIILSVLTTLNMLVSNLPQLETCLSYTMENAIILKMLFFIGVSSITLTSDIWSGNAKEDYIIVVAHFINVDTRISSIVPRFHHH